MTTLANILKLLPALNEQELRQLNSAACEMLRSANHIKQIRAGSQFHIGQNVKFTSKHGREIVISIDKINAKTIHGTELAADGSIGRFAPRWKVSPSMCKAI